MAKNHLELAVRYATSGVVTELSIRANEVIKTLSGDIEHIIETMTSAGIGVSADLIELSKLCDQLKAGEKLLIRSEKAGRKVSREMREALQDA